MHRPARPPDAPIFDQRTAALAASLAGHAGQDRQHARRDQRRPYSTLPRARAIVALDGIDTFVFSGDLTRLQAVRYTLESTS